MNGSSSEKYILVSVLKKKEKTPGFSELQGSCNSLGSQGCMPCGFESAFVPCLVSVTAGYLGIIGGRRLEQVFPTSSNRKYLSHEAVFLSFSAYSRKEAQKNIQRSTYHGRLTFKTLKARRQTSKGTDWFTGNCLEH